jgi:hypothetical protein
VRVYIFATATTSVTCAYGTCTPTTATQIGALDLYTQDCRCPERVLTVPAAINTIKEIQVFDILDEVRTSAYTYS